MNTFCSSKLAERSLRNILFYSNLFLPRAAALMPPTCWVLCLNRASYLLLTRREMFYRIHNIAA
jgi:hypothetical protein